MRFLTYQVGFSRTPNAVQHAGKKKLDEGALKNILCHLLFSHLAPSFERRIAGRVLLRRCYSAPGNLHT